MLFSPAGLEPFFLQAGAPGAQPTVIPIGRPSSRGKARARQAPCDRSDRADSPEISENTRSLFMIAPRGVYAMML